jgi:hypothetical protein
MQIIGKLHAIFETKQITERFQKREFVVETNDNPTYPQMVLFQLTGDRCETINSCQIGDDVTIEFSVRGREWKSPSGEIKYFNSLDAWTVETDTTSSPDKAPFESEPPWPTDDDVPF